MHFNIINILGGTWDAALGNVSVHDFPPQQSLKKLNTTN